ncbi:MAG: ATP-binding protein, partial [Acidobacteriota bacterium]
QFIGDNLRFMKDVAAALTGLVEPVRGFRKAALKVPELREQLQSLDDQVEKADLEFLLSEFPTSIEESLHGVDRITRIVSAMKDFSHPGGGEAVPSDLNRLVESTLTVARNEWKYVAEVKLDLDPDLTLVPCRASEFNQAFLNIVVNAAHAIRSANEGSKNLGVITVTTASNGEMAEVRVADTGTGIPDKVLPRIFDPFFTTKEVGQGTGQGLAISRSIIVERHGGKLRCESEPGRGTTFIIQLPLSPAAGDSSADGEPQKGGDSTWRES